jgi:hypothetical protein
MKIYIGIDPGAKGALVAYFKQYDIQVWEYAKVGLKGYCEALNNITTISSNDEYFIGLEKVNSMPGQGVRAMFSFGQKYGEIQGMLVTMQLGFDLVQPLMWQRKCGVVPKSGKKGIFSAVTRLYPTVPFTGPRGGIKDGVCDATGIMHYMRQKY